MVMLLLEHNADVNTPIITGQYKGMEYPLGLASRRGYNEVIKVLLKHHADPKAINTWKAKLKIYSGSALHMAYRCEKEETAQLLIELCPELENMTNDAGERPDTIQKLTSSDK